MYYFPDFLVLVCLFTSGLFFGYYCKYAYIYDNLWSHWFSLLGAAVAIALAGGWTVRKYRQKQYSFDHFYIIFYGLTCFLISGVFMLTENLDISFYFGFVGLGTVVIPCYSYVSLRSNSQGWRPARIALGNALYYGGLTTGFNWFNEFEPRDCGWLYLLVTVVTICGVVLNEILQHFGVHNYKQSCDLVFNLMNDEKIVFVPTRAVYALFIGRPEFYLTTNRQWWVTGLSAVVVLERSFPFSWSFLQLTWSSTFAYMGTQHLYAPFLLYTIGCVVGCVLLVRYRPKLIYLMFGLIEATVTAAILGVYADDLTEHCFIFLCFYYVSMGVYSSIAVQMVLECTPFLYTELALALALALELLIIETLKFESRVENTSAMLLGIGIGASIVFTSICIVLVQLLLPPSGGLIDMRNKLLGVRRHRPAVPQTKIWTANFFLHHDLQSDKLKSVKLEGNRVFHQYPSNIDKKPKV